MKATSSAPAAADIGARTHVQGAFRLSRGPHVAWKSGSPCVDWRARVVPPLSGGGRRRRNRGSGWGGTRVRLATPAAAMCSGGASQGVIGSKSRTMTARTAMRPRVPAAACGPPGPGREGSQVTFRTSASSVRAVPAGSQIGSLRDGPRTPASEPPHSGVGTSCKPRSSDSQPRWPVRAAGCPERWRHRWCSIAIMKSS